MCVCTWQLVAADMAACAATETKERNKAFGCMKATLSAYFPGELDKYNQCKRMTEFAFSQMIYKT